MSSSKDQNNDAASLRITTKQVHLDRERGGYWYEGVFREGFLDDPALSVADRRFVAGWARALTPHTFDKTQQDLLSPLPASAPMSKAQREAGALHHLLWGEEDDN